jgi:hypothetical protein
MNRIATTTAAMAATAFLTLAATAHAEIRQGRALDPAGDVPPPAPGESPTPDGREVRILYDTVSGRVNVRLRLNPLGAPVARDGELRVWIGSGPGCTRSGEIVGSFGRTATGQYTAGTTLTEPGAAPITGTATVDDDPDRPSLIGKGFDFRFTGLTGRDYRCAGDAALWPTSGGAPFDSFAPGSFALPTVNPAGTSRPGAPGATSPNSPTGPGAPPTATGDRQGPVVSLGRAALRRGALHVPVTGSEASRLTVEVRLDRRTARRLRLRTVVGRTRQSRRTASTRTARVTLNRRVRRLLARGRRLRAVVRVIAVDGSGNRTVTDRRVLLRR